MARDYINRSRKFAFTRRDEAAFSKLLKSVYPTMMFGTGADWGDGHHNRQDKVMFLEFLRNIYPTIMLGDGTDRASSHDSIEKCESSTIYCYLPETMYDDPVTKMTYPRLRFAMNRSRWEWPYPAAYVFDPSPPA